MKNSSPNTRVYTSRSQSVDTCMRNIPFHYEQPVKISCHYDHHKLELSQMSINKNKHKQSINKENLTYVQIKTTYKFIETNSDKYFPHNLKSWYSSSMTPQVMKQHPCLKLLGMINSCRIIKFVLL